MSSKVVFPEEGFVRVNQILGDRRKGIAPFLPISRAHWFQGIKEGIYPKGIKLSQRVTVWRAQEIRALLEKLAGDGSAE